MGAITYRLRAKTNRVILHDSHTETEYYQYEDVPRWAQQAKYGGLRMGLLTTGYHYIIERTGERVACRDIEVMGTHTPGQNMDSIGICLVGGRESGSDKGVDNFNYDQKMELFKIMEELRLRWPGLPISGHSEVQRYRNRNLPPCPPINMRELREEVDMYCNREKTT